MNIMNTVKDKTEHAHYNKYLMDFTDPKAA